MPTNKQDNIMEAAQCLWGSLVEILVDAANPLHSNFQNLGEILSFSSNGCAAARKKLRDEKTASAYIEFIRSLTAEEFIASTIQTPSRGDVTGRFLKNALDPSLNLYPDWKERCKNAI